MWSSVAEPELDIGAPSSSNSQQPVYHGKCGCRAGCTFFGRNANGLDFFDHDETGSYVALANPLRRNGDPSFGQSILHDNVWLVDLLESSDADSVAQSRHKSTSELSNSSTVKNMDDVFVHSSKSQSIRDEATLSSIDPRSRISLSSIVSLQELTNHSGDSLSRGRTTSTPALLSMSNENCRRIHPQVTRQAYSYYKCIRSVHFIDISKLELLRNEITILHLYLLGMFGINFLIFLYGNIQV